MSPSRGLVETVALHGMSWGGPPGETGRRSVARPAKGGPVAQYVGIGWACRRAAWCARGDSGAIAGEGRLPADEDGLIKLVLARGSDVKACVEMMSGAVWVRDRLRGRGRGGPGRARGQGA
jgi:hypothetical protein